MLLWGFPWIPVPMPMVLLVFKADFQAAMCFVGDDMAYSAVFLHKVVSDLHRSEDFYGKASEIKP